MRPRHRLNITNHKSVLILCMLRRWQRVCSLHTTAVRGSPTWRILISRTILLSQDLFDLEITTRPFFGSTWAKRRAVKVGWFRVGENFRHFGRAAIGPSGGVTREVSVGLSQIQEALVGMFVSMFKMAASERTGIAISMMQRPIDKMQFTLKTLSNYGSAMFSAILPEIANGNSGIDNAVVLQSILIGQFAIEALSIDGGVSIVKVGFMDAPNSEQKREVAQVNIDLLQSDFPIEIREWHHSLGVRFKLIDSGQALEHACHLVKSFNPKQGF